VKTPAAKTSTASASRKPSAKASTTTGAAKPARARTTAASTAKKAATAKTTAKTTTAKATTKAAAKKAPATKAPAAKGGTTKAPAKKTAAAKVPAKKATATTKAAAKKAPAKAAPAKAAPAKAPTKKAAVKSPFDAKFLDAQRALLLEERKRLVHDADSLTAEANALAEGREPGDVQFDEESGEGDTLAVERERDLALSAQFRGQVEEIDRALLKFDDGTYGICEVSGTPIPKERLKAIPWARERVEYKVGGFGRR
jgi:RNA polymerase-binding transcription factor DksA